jgi:hypothetical protein
MLKGCEHIGLKIIPCIIKYQLITPPLISTLVFNTGQIVLKGENHESRI